MNISPLLEMLAPYGLTTLLAFAWAISEVAQTFRGDVRRALINRWAGLLLLVNAAVAVFALILITRLHRKANSRFPSH